MCEWGGGGGGGGTERQKDRGQDNQRQRITRFYVQKLTIQRKQMNYMKYEIPRDENINIQG